MTPKPDALLLDLDDTILDDTGSVEACWLAACGAHVVPSSRIDVATLVDAIRDASRRYWSDPDRHRRGRLQLDAARRQVVRLAFADLGLGDDDLAVGIADEYSRRRELGIKPFPDAIETVRWLRGAGTRLALVTNGAAVAQRSKIDRFGLAELFDLILVEGEMECGKPDERVYRRALDDLGVEAGRAWMVGDNLEWDVAAPQRLGIRGVWLDVRRRGLPADARIVPDLVIGALAELRSLI